MLVLKSKPARFLSDSMFPTPFQTLFNTMLNDSKETQAAFNFIPSADVIETPDHYKIRMSIPGVKKEDVSLSVDGDHLTVEGNRNPFNLEDGHVFLKKEINEGKFSRSFKIGKLDTNLIEAKMDDGFLMITLPKLEVIKPKTIEIK